MAEYFDLTKLSDRKKFFNIFGPEVTRVAYTPMSQEIVFFGVDGKSICRVPENIFRIEWPRDYEAERPIDDNKLIGCLCRFWDEEGKDTERFNIGILKGMSSSGNAYQDHKGFVWPNCRPVLPQEIKFYKE